MPYKKIQTLCLSPEIPYKEAKPIIYEIYKVWHRKDFEQQAVDAPELLDTLLLIAQKKSRLINYTLDFFLTEIADWSYLIYAEKEELGTERFDAIEAVLINFLVVMIPNIKRGKTKISDNLRAQLLRGIANMLNMELHPEFLPLLIDSMMVMDTNEQLLALEALSNYFSWEETDLNKELVQKLEQIIATTKVRSSAFRALNVQVHAGVLDQFSAVVSMDNWKERNRDNW